MPDEFTKNSAEAEKMKCLNWCWKTKLLNFRSQFGWIFCFFLLLVSMKMKKKLNRRNMIYKHIHVSVMLQDHWGEHYLCCANRQKQKFAIFHKIFWYIVGVFISVIWCVDGTKMNIFAVKWNPCVSLSQTENCVESLSWKSTRPKRILCVRIAKSTHILNAVQMYSYGNEIWSPFRNYLNWHDENEITWIRSVCLCEREKMEIRTPNLRKTPAVRRNDAKIFFRQKKARTLRTVSVANFETLFVCQKANKHTKSVQSEERHYLKYLYTTILWLHIFFFLLLLLLCFFSFVCFWLLFAS